MSWSELTSSFLMPNLGISVLGWCDCGYALWISFVEIIKINSLSKIMRVLILRLLSFIVLHQEILSLLSSFLLALTFSFSVVSAFWVLSILLFLKLGDFTTKLFYHWLQPYTILCIVLLHFEHLLLKVEYLRLRVFNFLNVILGKLVPGKLVE